MKIKYIKLNKKLRDVDLMIYLQRLVLQNTNARLISLGLNRHCRKFVKELKEIPLSEELQKY